MAESTAFEPAPEPAVGADGVVHYRNITVARIQGFRPLHADLRVPSGTGRKPLIAFIHGGAFWGGSRVNLPHPLEALRSPSFYDRLTARGYAVADIDYRLSGEAVFPAQLQDVQAALAWLHVSAEVLGLDAGRFAVWGESAGATLAALAGLAQGAEPKVHAVVDWYGPTDFTGLRFFQDKPDDPAYQLFDAAKPGLESRARAGSPIRQIHPSAPPFLVMHGTEDRLVSSSESEKFAAALREAGVRADLVLVPGATHVFEGFGDVGGLVDTVLDFLDEVLPGA